MSKMLLTATPTVSFGPPPTRPADPKQVAQISGTTANAVTSRINQARRKPNACDMQLVSWDPEFTAEATQFAATIDPAWFFGNSGLPGPAGKGNSSYNGFHLTELPQFQKFGYSFLIHDTFVSPSKFPFIINFRLNQAHCINFTKCSPDQFTNFETCGDPLVLAPGQPCSWATQYYPRLLINSFNKMGCVIFKQHGPNAPKAQGWSFWCYGNFKQISNDMPFTEGPQCTKCPPETPRCVSNLCTA